MYKTPNIDDSRECLMMCYPQVPGDRQHQARGVGGQQAQAGHTGDRGQDRGIQAGEPGRLQLGNQGQVPNLNQ